MQVSLNSLYWATFILLTTTQAIQVAPLDTYQIGPYYVQNCKSNNNNMATLLKTMTAALQPAITDLGSTSSSKAYTTFFKDVSRAPYVRTVFSNVTKGVSVATAPGSPSSEPNFICVDARDQVTWDENGQQVDAYTRCGGGEWPAMALLTTPYIVICPLFFTQAAVPVQSSASCLKVRPYLNRFAQGGKSLIVYQVWHLLHELVHYYVYSTEQDSLDVYGVNQCVDLPGGKAMLNAQSYVYYVANIWLGCTKFPTVDTRPSGRFRGVELLETEANSTALKANESIALVVQNVSVQAVPLVQTSGDVDPDLTSRGLRRHKIVYG